MTLFNLPFFTNGVTVRWGIRWGESGVQKTGGSLAKVLARKGVYLLVGLSLGGLLGCAEELMQADWELYENPRYDFLFPYPNPWVEAPAVDNRDGRTFSDPNFEAVRITGWASQVSLPLDGDGVPSEELPLSPNFVTAQGIPGRLDVEIGMDMSMMTLRLSQDGVLYYWEGRSPSNLFDDYYEFFYYVAQNYRIEPGEEDL